MPTRKPTETVCPVKRFDVCAQYADEASVLAHAMLANDSCDWSKSNLSLRCVHINPKLDDNTQAVQVVGTANLDDAEILAIKTFVQGSLGERRALNKRLRLLGKENDRYAQYIIYPAVAPPSQDYPLWRFSCVGFVLQAYLRAGITLIDSNIPQVTLAELVRIYPHVSGLTTLERDELGIGWGSSWPVVFVGYVFASLARESSQIRHAPYVARIEDIEYLPVDEEPAAKKDR